MTYYSISLKLNGTRLSVSLMEETSQGSFEAAGDSVDLAPLLASAKAEGMREAARIASECDDGEATESSRTAAYISDAILSAIGGQK